MWIIFARTARQALLAHELRTCRASFLFRRFVRVIFARTARQTLLAQLDEAVRAETARFRAQERRVFQFRREPFFLRSFWGRWRFVVWRVVRVVVWGVVGIVCGVGWRKFDHDRFTHKVVVFGGGFNVDVRSKWSRVIIVVQMELVHFWGSPPIVVLATLVSTILILLSVRFTSIEMCNCRKFLIAPEIGIGLYRFVVVFSAVSARHFWGCRTGGYHRKRISWGNTNSRRSGSHISMLRWPLGLI